ncbi:hypothetical protein [Microbulbifer sp.]|uniref:hypothetical protein n=1 Tax=Microbulbifer sp. TaxID=1908541 RepID=UPI003F2F4704
MRGLRFLLCFICVFGSFSCVKDTEVGGSVDSSMLDLNGDGVPDISYEDADDGYYEFVDRNFDGRVDVSNYYGKDDKVVSSKLDDNFDGTLETKTIYKNGSPVATAVDVTCNGLADILFVYEFDVIEFSENFNLVGPGASKGSIERVIYRFGLPVEKKILDKEVEHKAFHESSMSYLSGHTYRGCL